MKCSGCLETVAHTALSGVIHGSIMTDHGQVSHKKMFLKFTCLVPAKKVSGRFLL